MLRTTLAGLRLHKSRLFTTALAIVLGVMFVTGTLVFTDTLRESFGTQVMGSAEKLDAVALADLADVGPDDEVPRLAPETLAEIEDLPEVAAAQGVIKGDAPLLDADGRAMGTLPTLGISVGGGVERYEAAEGRLPTAGDEVALATTSADQGDYEVGDAVGVLDSEGEEHAFTVTGLIDFGLDQEVGYRGAVAFTPDATERMTGVGEYAEIDVIGTEGTPAAEVKDAVAAVAGGDAEVMTGRELGEELADAAGAQADVMATGLLLFAAIAVFVAALVIYNTFAILIAQRQREMALLRCVGATRGQVFRGVLVEAVIIGLLSSAVGVAVGIGLGAGAFTVGGELLANGSSVPASPVISPLAVGVGLLVGTAVTLVASLLPARRATKVPPLAALRTSAVANGMEKGIGRLRVCSAAVFLLGSGAVLGGALAGEPGQQALMLVVASGMLCFVGVLIIGPLLVRAVVGLVGRPMRRIGVPSMLAADNARRSPKRAATAMIALTVGATLMTGYSVISASLQTTMNEMLEEQFPVDFALMPQLGEDGGGVPAPVGEELRESPEIGKVFSSRSTEADVDGEPVRPSAYLGADIGTDISSDVESGDLDGLGPGAVTLNASTASRLDVGFGEEITLEGADGEESFEIVAVVSDMGSLPGLTMDESDFAAVFPDADTDERVYVNAAEGVSSGEARDAVDAAIAEYPTVRVDGSAELKQQYTQMLDIMFMTVSALLALAIIIAVFGIANTMALSVLERTRESALLRALGLARPQLRRMLSIEAVLVSVIGTGVGIGLGVLFGWAAGATAIGDMTFTLPAARIAVFIAVAVVAGLLAAVMPARRAAGTSITGALAAE
ncbi:putative ABC transport system permease protein [Spinactinospora alkalitolerans]|uniref:Putative ABC transport system permease protein n=1 Tax=Spinactinospora alkalitolerans TaxID=687207 RepID=A0A852TR46_9ACTN|nr:ABC transporter permease [Spinactinospora alkalitolerans]NYE46866.1 putative ABC transport system permease protein [Spinactinospora alkalitolerans]